MNNRYYNEDFFTKEQLKAIKKVENAMKAAHSLGVIFWDDYGGLSAYSEKNITQPVPDNIGGEGDTLLEKGVMSYTLAVKNFHAGNADDDLFCKIIKLNTNESTNNR